MGATPRGRTDMDLQALQDRVEITDLLHRYARALDTKDWDLLASVFTPDAHLDYTSSGCPAGPRDEVVPWLARVLEPVPMRSEEHTSELQSRQNLVCRLLLEKKRAGRRRP